MKKMRKLLSAILVVVMLGVLAAGCSGKSDSAGNSGNDSSGDTKKEEEGKTFKVGYANKTLNNPYFVALDAALKEEVEALGWKYASLDADEDINNGEHGDVCQPGL